MQPYSRSHSRSHFNGHKKPPNFSTNGNNGGGYVSTSYDDVFGGPPKYATLAPRAEDYSEIFGAFRSSSATCNSRASSIPVLDLPDAAGVGGGAGVEFDYSDVFEGFGDVGFAVSFDQLFRPFDARHCCSSSSDDDDEAWTPVGAESLSDDSDPFALSEKSQSFLNENLDRPVDKQFSVSYNRVNLGTNTCISNMTHVAQLNAVPGFTCIVDETTSLKETGAKGCNPAEVDDIVFNVNSSSILPEKHKTKNIYAASSSHVTSPVESVSDINHIAKSSNSPPLSRPPSETAKGKGEIRSTSGLKTSDDCSLEVLGNNKLPPCFDMEVGASSFATASTAAMKDAMKKAQAKLKATTLQSLPDKPIAQQRNFVAVNPAERKHEKKCSLSMNSVFIEADGKLKDATPSNVDGKKISSFMKRFDDGHNSDSAEDVIVPEGNRPRLKTIKSVSRQAYYEKMSKVALEAHDSAIGNSQGNHKEQKGKSGYESEKNARKIGHMLQVEKNSTSNDVKIKSKNDLGDEEIKRKEGKKKGSKAKEAYEEQKTENKLADPVEQRKGKEEKKVKEKRSKEPSPSETDSDGNQEFGQKKDMKRKTFVDVFGREKLERTSDFQENENKIDVLLRNEDGNFVEVAVRKEGSETILEECVEPGEHRKYQDAPEKFVRPERQRQDEYHKRSYAYKESKEGPNRVNDGKKIEKSMKHGIEDKAIRVDEGSQNFVCGSPVIIEWHDDEIELPVEDEYMKAYGRNGVYGRSVEVQSDTPTAKVGSSRIADDEVHNVCAHRNGKVSAVYCDKERNLKSVDTAYVLINEKLIESSAAEMGCFDGKGEKRVHTSNSYDGNVSNSKSGELSNRSKDIMKHKNEKIGQSVIDPLLVKDYNIEKVNIKSTPAKAISGCNEWGHEKSKDKAHAATHPPDVSQSTEQKGKTSNENRNFEEKTKNKGNDSNEGQLRMLEEEKERQREREKDRNALEIARKRMMNEARERLEKACADARERSFSDKASESRLKADRIAVERATAEAHQRAIEKAMAERASFEAQERMKRSISEKYLPERDVVKRQSSMPSMHSEEFEAGDVEPVQRCKARLERHHRTVERVAKALAEKNMRDLLAQKEQAERSRLAETLGADIKRWSNGKEGNLRALLSTLQYILGPDSGWQPIPLTEVITATAVKKAYRKAALCVHPDKLQQRGASIQHKYVCEKVFDLLKEAWNRFNSEEK